jgi:quinol-cytochrome oxidoreductase complex cytochrome b subunit
MNTLKKKNFFSFSFLKNFSSVFKYLYQALANRMVNPLLIHRIKSYLPANWTRITKNYLIGFIMSHLVFYPSPICLTYAWSFGSIAGVCLVIQMLSGIFLAMYYITEIDYAFSSIEFIMRDVKYGWLIRYIHSNGASMFFIAVYAHICRGLYYGSYMKPRELLWCSGVVLLILMMATAFTGYVLPWGQMSFWGATVVTSMVTIVPVGGKQILEWIWGQYVIGNPTLHRIFSLHFFLPFVIAGMTLIHLALLHQVGSNSPIGSDTGVDDLPFYPYFVVKDAFALSCFTFVFAIYVFYFPNVLNHPDNYIPANPIKTPRHVVPEWYFLPFFTILRAIPYKTSGILTMAASILVLFTTPFIYYSNIRNTTYRPIFKPFFWMFIASVYFLFWVGEQEIDTPFTEIGRYATVGYFFFYLFAVPFAGRIEEELMLYGLFIKDSSLINNFTIFKLKINKFLVTLRGLSFLDKFIIVYISCIGFYYQNEYLELIHYLTGGSENFGSKDPFSEDFLKHITKHITEHVLKSSK